MRALILEQKNISNFRFLALRTSTKKISEKTTKTVENVAIII